MFFPLESGSQGPSLQEIRGCGTVHISLCSGSKESGQCCIPQLSLYRGGFIAALAHLAATLNLNIPQNQLVAALYGSVRFLVESGWVYYHVAGYPD